MCREVYKGRAVGVLWMFVVNSSSSLYRQTGRRMDRGRTDRWTDKQVDRQTEVLTEGQTAGLYHTGR